MGIEATPLGNMSTLGVDDFTAQRAFYQRRGWPLVFDGNDFAVFELRGAVRAAIRVNTNCAARVSGTDGWIDLPPSCTATTTSS